MGGGTSRRPLDCGWRHFDGASRNVLSVGGSSWELYVGHGLLIGLVGNAALNAPIYVYVSRWFQRRRGTALSLISSGQYIAGAVWPPVFERTIALFGWRPTMVGFGVAAAGTIIPLALVYLKASPPSHQPASLPRRNQSNARPALSPNVFFVSLLIASFRCCIPMAMPSAHLIAFCGDLGMLPVRGALALSMLLVCAFISRQFWGWVSDRYGGLPTLVICSTVQAAATAGFVYTQSEAELFAVAAVFGLDSADLSLPTYLPCANCSQPNRPIGASRWCSSSACRAWRWEVGGRGSSTITRALMLPLSRPASSPIW